MDKDAAAKALKQLPGILADIQAVATDDPQWVADFLAENTDTYIWDIPLRNGYTLCRLWTAQGWPQGFRLESRNTTILALRKKVVLEFRFYEFVWERDTLVVDGNMNEAVKKAKDFYQTIFWLAEIPSRDNECRLDTDLVTRLFAMTDEEILDYREKNGPITKRD